LTRSIIRHTAVPMILAALLYAAIPAAAQIREATPSTNDLGTLGLISIPTARMDESGTYRAGLSTVDPYIHGYMGFQVTPSLYLNFRQTGETSSLNDPIDRIYPGIDAKILLKKETASSPAVALGFNSAFGHKRLSSEYLSFSKRFDNFDVTAGAAWGRLGSAGHIKNPLHALSSHFKKDRNPLSEETGGIDQWFTGEQIGFFAGAEYFTPIKGLSIKGEYGANDYAPEKTDNGYNAPKPWSIGLNYQPKSWADISLALYGGNKVMARLSLQDQFQDWIGENSETDAPPAYPPRYESEKHYHKAQNKQKLYIQEAGTALARLNLGSNRTAPKQIGRAARVKPESNSHLPLTFALHHKGLRGPDITLMQDDLKRLFTSKDISPEEIWRDALINHNKLNQGAPIKLKTAKTNLSSIELPYNRPMTYRLILDNRLSLSEDDVGPLYRSSAVIETEQEWPYGFITGLSGRVNIANNLSYLELVRSTGNALYGIDNLNTRRNVDSFAAQRALLDRSYISWLKTVKRDLHFGASIGLLEEMFGGFGAEVLYRPYNKRIAAGAELWRVAPRNPSSFDGRLYDENRVSGHVNLFYELPDDSAISIIPTQNTTAFMKVGQYLAEDFGATIGLNSNFKNGASVKAFITATNQSDVDILGGKSNVHTGLKFTFPLGNIPYVPDGSEIRTTIEPMGRDTGQILDKPVDLYALTEPMSYRQLSQNWPDLNE